jgi:hypothetical protein
MTIISKIIVCVSALIFSKLLVAAPFECDANENIIELIRKSKVVLFGEIHGTSEFPDYFYNVSCSLSKQNIPLKIGVEIPISSMDSVADYMNSDGGNVAEHKLLSTAHWSKAYQDGRTSVAMLRLLQNLRKLASENANVKVFVFDDESKSNRDYVMSQHVLLQLREDPNTIHLLLTGNIHSQTTQGVPQGRIIVC